MGALYLKDLADKTRRGLRGRIEAGKSGGGNSYGYDVVRGLGTDGLPLTGERRINARAAAIVRRIFEEYAAGVSPRAIAKRLNAEGVLGPSGKAGGRVPSTATASAAPAFSTMSFILAGWSGTVCAM
jgi:site-specific DNA recombinase